MSYSEVLKKEGSFRKAATALGLTKSKFIRLYKTELGLCQRRTNCTNKPEEGKSACREHLDYVCATSNKVLRKENYKKWRVKNKEKIAKANKEWQRANLPRIRAYNKERRKLPSMKLYGRVKAAHRRACKYKASPSWVDKDALSLVYKACPKGSHVDHIIPLISDQVCGLHVPWNLQYISAFANDSKANQFDGTYDNLSWKLKICHQHIRRMETLEEDKKSGMPFDLEVSDFEFSNEKLSVEIKEFIKKYEWLGSIGWSVKWAFTARHKGLLAGVVLMSEPVKGMKFSRFNDKKSEALIQRGAASSWSPKNLNSALLMFGCRWMTQNTDKRVFIGYSDSDAGEIGTIYQACNFDYLGKHHGNNKLYVLSTGKKVGARYFTRTASMKKWCKELGITWLKDWEKDNGFQDVSKIPDSIKSTLKDYAMKKLKSCETFKIAFKGKYILLLGRDRREQKQLDKLKCQYKAISYPKR